MSKEEKKDDKDNTKSSDTAKTEASAANKKAKALADASAKAAAAAKAVEDAENAVREAMAKAHAAKADVEAAAEEEYKAIAALSGASPAKKSTFTYKRDADEIFRRDMGEPEFFLNKEDRFQRPVLTAEQQESLTREVEIPRDQTPPYVPTNVLSPEFGGMSNYERGVNEFLDETRDDLERLRYSPDATERQIKDAEDKVTYLESLHENFFVGMNVFRTAKGGRDRLGAK